MAYTIVSFCGGGIRGLISAKVLEMLAHHNEKILTRTHLLAGTSVGSSIISGLVAHKSPQTLIHELLEAAREFFSKPSSKADAPAYSNHVLLERLYRLHHDRTLSSLLPQQVLFTAFCLGAAPRDGDQATPWFPQLFTNVQSPLISTADTRIVDAVAACEAMPAMFPSYVFPSKMFSSNMFPLKRYVDGAFVHHDPTLAAIAVAVSSGIALEDIVVICLGTGFMENWIGSDTTQWGANQWLHGDGTNNYQLPALLVNEGGVCPILNLCLNGTSTKLIPLLSQMLLAGRYVYLNPVLDQYIPETAHDPEQLRELLSKAEALRSSELWQQAIDLLDTYW